MPPPDQLHIPLSMSIIEQRRAAILQRMTAAGSYDPDCETCRRKIGSYEDPSSAFYPRHTASSSCRSGKRAHCTCDTCF